MRNAATRSGRTLISLLFCFVGTVVIAVGIGARLMAVRVTEQLSSEHSSVPGPADYKNAPVSADQRAASNANGQFAVDLYQKLAATESEKNLFLSPFSISSVLTMVAEGAVDQTLDQMLDVLHVPQGALGQIHSGQRELNRTVVPVVPPEVTARLTALRKKLSEINQRTESLKKAQSFEEARASWITGFKLAEEINSLTNRISACELQIANALWVDKAFPIEPDFVSTVQPNYGAVLFPVDFRGSPEPARTQINQWVTEQTNDRIQNLLAPGSVTDQTRLLITNTVYFRGDWDLPFDAASTHPKPFHQSNDQAIEVPMMHQWNFKSASYGAFTAAGDDFKTPLEVRLDIKDDDPSLYPDARGHTMLSLDYQGHKIQMILLVPQSATGISDLEKSLSYDTLQRWIGQMQKRTVKLSIPKFKLESRYQLTEPLQSLGMARAFQDPRQHTEGAQFDKLSSTQRSEDRLYISGVIHQTYVDVNEIGTEAAAATSLDTVAEGPGDDSKTRPFVPIFKADKPFLFLIRDRETATILFLGRYVSPKA